MSNITTNVLSNNKSAAITAAVLETGRIANSTAAKIIGPKLPIMLRGYADTPFGALAIANAAKMAAEQFRPECRMTQRVTEGMMVAAYQSLLAELDLEAMLDELMDNTRLQRATKKLVDEEQSDETPSTVPRRTRK